MESSEYDSSDISLDKHYRGLSNYNFIHTGLGESLIPKLISSGNNDLFSKAMKGPSHNSLKLESHKKPDNIEPSYYERQQEYVKSLQESHLPRGFDTPGISATFAYSSLR